MYDDHSSNIAHDMNEVFHIRPYILPDNILHCDYVNENIYINTMSVKG